MAASRGLDGERPQDVGQVAALHGDGLSQEQPGGVGRLLPLLSDARPSAHVDGAGGPPAVGGADRL
jgi:hypothetical protein